MLGSWPRKWIAIILCVFALLGNGCKRSGKYAAQIEALESADPAADVNRAIAAGDLRFVGVIGVALIVPGAPDWVHVTPQGHVRYIPNTSDAFESEEHARLQQIAYNYAEKYNRILLTKMPKLATTQPATRGAAVPN